MAATSPRLGLDHVTVVPADPDPEDAAEPTDSAAEAAEPADRGSS